MDEQLDNDLRDHIKAVFDDFEDTPEAANEGWLKLREKFPEEQRDRGIFAWIWWGAAAAILLLFLGVGLWVFSDQNANNQLLTSKTTKARPAQQMAVTTEKQPDSTKNTAVLAKADKGKNSLVRVVAQTKSAGTAMGIRQKNTFLPIVGGVSNNSQSVSKSKEFPEKNNSDNTAYIAGVGNEKGDNVVKRDSAELAKHNEKASTLIAAVKNDTAGVKSIIIQPAHKPKSIETMFAEDKKLNPEKNTDEPRSASKRVHFEVYAATFFNYAKGSDNEFNAGAGFSTDIRISKNLKLVTGVSIAQNKLTYGDNSQQVAVEAAAISNQILAVSGGTKYNNAAIPNPAFAVSPSVKSYNADLTGLDIPLNLKYEFNPDKGNAYITAGVSSGTFISESYTSQYNYSSFYNSTSPTQAQTTSKSFDSFYFARTLNVAFGLGYPLGRNHLVIEPFLKYPLDGLGAQQIKFGAGGLNLKFNFQPSKK